jgi:hypothetical protein
MVLKNFGAKENDGMVCVLVWFSGNFVVIPYQ